LPLSALVRISLRACMFYPLTSCYIADLATNWSSITGTLAFLSALVSTPNRVEGLTHAKENMD
jgi:hypothetical protein